MGTPFYIFAYSWTVFLITINLGKTLSTAIIGMLIQIRVITLGDFKLYIWLQKTVFNLIIFLNGMTLIILFYYVA